MREFASFTQLVESIDKIPVVETRIASKNLREFVVKSDFITRLHLNFQNIFGPDFKAPGENPSLGDRKRAAPLGGVREDQTLYYCETENFSVCAMMWPWSDGRRYTVKLAQNRLGKIS